MGIQVCASAFACVLGSALGWVKGAVCHSALQPSTACATWHVRPQPPSILHCIVIACPRLPALPLPPLPAACSSSSLTSQPAAPAYAACWLPRGSSCGSPPPAAPTGWTTRVRRLLLPFAQALPARPAAAFTVQPAPGVPVFRCRGSGTLVPHHGCRLPALRGAIPGSGGGPRDVRPRGSLPLPGAGGVGGQAQPTLPLPAAAATRAHALPTRLVCFSAAAAAAVGAHAGAASAPGAAAVHPWRGRG